MPSAARASQKIRSIASACRPASAAGAGVSCFTATSRSSSVSSPRYTVAVPPPPMGATSWYRPAIRPSWAGAVMSCPLPEAGQAAPWLITVNRDISMTGARSRLLIPSRLRPERARPQHGNQMTYQVEDLPGASRACSPPTSWARQPEEGGLVDMRGHDGATDLVHVDRIEQGACVLANEPVSQLEQLTADA